MGGGVKVKGAKGGVKIHTLLMNMSTHMYRVNGNNINLNNILPRNMFFLMFNKILSLNIGNFRKKIFF